MIDKRPRTKDQGRAAGADSSASGGSSYAQILRSSSIIAGATGINYIIGLVRIRFLSCLPRLNPVVK